MSATGVLLAIAIGFLWSIILLLFSVADILSGLPQRSWAMSDSALPPDGAKPNF
jgi:hypothetical protein